MSVGLGVMDMAKARKPKARIGRPPGPSEPKRQIIGVRGTVEFKGWLVRFAESERSDLSDLIDDALEAYAKERGFEAPPKR